MGKYSNLLKNNSYFDFIFFLSECMETSPIAKDHNHPILQFRNKVEGRNIENRNKKGSLRLDRPFLIIEKTLYMVVEVHEFQYI